MPALGYLWGNSNLYRVDKATGAFAVVGNTGHTSWMDLAFDSHGTLWATKGNELWTLDPQTGASAFVTPIHGVPDAGDPRWMEVMSIAFDDNDVLYGTAMTVYYDDPDGSPVMRIDTSTGVATLLGRTQAYYNHGGDIYPVMAKVAHRDESGQYACLKVSMEALPAHLEHGELGAGNGWTRLSMPVSQARGDSDRGEPRPSCC